jgi:phosphatidylglycerophosphatase A
MKKIARIISVGFGSGLSPKAPGTCGTIAALMISLIYLTILEPPDLYLRILFALFMTLIGILSISIILEDYPEDTKKDPQEIVIDEFAGFFTTILFTPWTFPGLLVGFLLFRFFDITKIGPVKKLELLPGSYGIMLDDIGAGVFAGVVLFLVSYFVY